MSSINFNDYANYTNYDSGYDVSALLGGTSNASGNMISDYATIKMEVIEKCCFRRQELP